MQTLALALLVLLAAASSSAYARQLEARSARAVVQANEDAWKRMDLDTAQALHSVDCTITDASPGKDGKLVTAITECRAMFDTGRKSYNDLKAKGGRLLYDYKVKQVTLRRDKAVVSLRVFVEMNVSGNSMRMEMDQDETVQSRGNKLLITAVKSTTTSEVVNGKRVF